MSRRALSGAAQLARRRPSCFHLAAVRPTHARRHSSSSAPAHPDIAAVLARPSWSVRSLLPPSEPLQSAEAGSSSSAADAPTITPSQLHHLLRLSALPQPSSPAEEARMISTLQSQLHFVKDIQAVDVDGVEALRAIRDETDEGFAEATVGVEQLRDVLDKEVAVGRGKRPRRVKQAVDARGVEDWHVLGTAEMTAGRYFVVKTGKRSED